MFTQNVAAITINPSPSKGKPRRMAWCEKLRASPKKEAEITRTKVKPKKKVGVG